MFERDSVGSHQADQVVVTNPPSLTAYLKYLKIERKWGKEGKDPSQ